MTILTSHAPLHTRRISPLLNAFHISKAVMMTMKQRWIMARVFYLKPYPQDINPRPRKTVGKI